MKRDLRAHMDRFLFRLKYNIIAFFMLTGSLFEFIHKLLLVSSLFITEATCSAGSELE